MAEKIELTNSTARLSEFNRNVDTSFKYFVEQEEVVDKDTVSELFRLYNKLYNEIPATGTNSHQILVEQSSKIYITPEDPIVELLQNEITDLRRQLLEANETITELSDINTDIAGISLNG